MIKAADFRKGIIFKEWEHKKLRMEIEDLQSMLNTVESVKVRKFLQLPSFIKLLTIEVKTSEINSIMNP